MKGRFYQLPTLTSRLWIIKKTLFSFENIKFL